MGIRVHIKKHTLHFRMEASTSRGAYSQKDGYFLKITDTSATNEQVGWGEFAPLPQLSIDALPDIEKRLEKIASTFNKADIEVFPWNLNMIVDQFVPKKMPALRFAFETALLGYLNGGKQLIFNNTFAQGERPININGLIWMGKPEYMLAQIEEKLAEGYTCLKLKIGAINFEEECRLLAYIRQRFSAEQITIRVDANGAFSVKDAPKKLKKLAEFNLHSIEQPIRPRKRIAMSQLIQNSPIPIALDEELIGIHEYFNKMKLLKQLMPAYIVLKPTLLGGFAQCQEWIEIANRLKINWWITSAMESNIGLNAIAQFAASFNNDMPQGLGTGQLFLNNIESPLWISAGRLHYNTAKDWNFSVIEQQSDLFGLPSKIIL